MKTNRRFFLKAAGVAGTGMVTGAMASCASNQENNPKSAVPYEISKRGYKQKINMSGYNASKLNEILRE